MMSLCVVYLNIGPVHFAMTLSYSGERLFTPLSWTPPTTSIDQCAIMTLISIITTLYVKHYPCATITFSMIHCNIRSIPKNMQQLELFLSNLILKFTIMAFSETWLNCTNHTLFSIDGYNCESAHRSSRREEGFHCTLKSTLDTNSAAILTYLMRLWRANSLKLTKNM